MALALNGTAVMDRMPRFAPLERPSSSPLAALAARPGDALAGIERKSHGRKRLLRKLG
jgi:hypothetical protein